LGITRESDWASRRLGSAHTKDSLMERFWIDLRNAARVVRRAPGFAMLAAITLGLGIGSTAAMFGIIDRIILRGPVGIVQPERVMRVYETVRRPGNDPVTGSTTGYATYTTLRDNVRDFSGVSVYQENSWIIGTGADARSLPGVAASADLFGTLGVRPYRGRFYSAAEDAPRSARDVVVLSYDYWKQSFGGDAAVLGRTMNIMFRPFTIIGIAPRGFTGVELSPVNYWIPLSTISAPRRDWPTTWRAQWVQVVARLRPGIDADQAGRDATAAFRQAYDGPNPDRRMATLSLRPTSFTSDGVESPIAPVARWLAAVTFLVLLIACANIGNLMLARALRRRAEIAVRLVLGMTRGQLVRLLIAEGMILTALGGAVGLGVAYVGGSAIRGYFLSQVEWTESAVDLRVFAIICALTAAVGMLVTMIPIGQTVAIDLSQAVRAQSRQGGGGRHRLRGLLLMMQTTVTSMLLVVAGLFVRSLINVRGVDLGLQPDRVIAASVWWPTAATTDSATNARIEVEQRLTIDRIRDTLAHRGDVEAASLVIGSPFRTSMIVDLSVPGWDSIPSLGGGGPYVVAVGHDYFRTVGTRLIYGRLFEPLEGAKSPRTAIVNETMARTLWPAKSALGRCLLIGGSTQCATVVGVVADAHRFRIREEPAMQYYVPLGQEMATSDPTVLVRPRGPARAALEVVRRTIASAAPGARYVDVDVMQHAIEREIRPWRLGASMFGVFAMLALIVAAAGLYSVISYVVAERTREFGVRVAIGATTMSIVGLVLRGGLRFVALGIVVATGIALTFAGRIGPDLFDVSPRDPTVYAGVGALMLVVASAALVIPALRASRVDPARTLREE
ncbi:MAG TPA: ADOP family duplicated permease, partial [Gemmatimonadaceae bacterium]|nr:ADOP family duplicated permease [Gemmatimonadaceae bacterium]